MGLQGADPDNLYVVAKGTLTAEQVSPGADEGPKRIGRYKTGDMFGELSTVFGGVRGNSVRADTDVELWATSRSQLQASDHGVVKRIFDRYASVEHDGVKYMTMVDVRNSVLLGHGEPEDGVCLQRHFLSHII